MTMAPTDEVALRLRFREHHSPTDAPDVAAFLRGSSPDVPERREPREVGVLPGRRPLQPNAPLVIFFQYASHGIPALAPEPAPLDTSSWTVRPTAFGYLARVPRTPRGGLARSRAAWVMAACLPLVVPHVAQAAPSKAEPTVQRPEEASVPDAPDSATGSDTDTSPEAEGTPETGTEPATGPVDPAPLEARTDPPPPPPPVVNSKTAPNPAILDAAWEGVDGFDVELELKGHQKMRGRVGAVQRDTFTLIQAKTGAVLVLPKSGVLTLRVRTPPALPNRNGNGLLIGGGILTGISAPVFISGLTFIGLCPSCTSLHLPMLLIGGGGLSGGIPMLVRGARFRKAYQEAVRERGLTPVAFRTRDGWTGGLRFRF